MSLIHNERTKLTATYLNGLAIALFAVGTVAPIISVMSMSIAVVRPSSTIIPVICIGVSGALHYAARYVLGRLRP